jgi:cytochrome c
MWLDDMRHWTIVFVLIGGFMISGCKAKPPATEEVRLMWSMKHHVFIGNKKQMNPIKPTPKAVADGREAFSHYCAACHGLDGQNTGVPFADRMAPPVPSLVSTDVQQYTDGQLKWVIDNGIWPTGMPASRGMLNDEEIWSIVVFIRHLPRAGTLGDPKMYDQ